MMTDIDAVAKAICEAEGHHWLNHFPETQDIYRRMAQAAIDSLHLARESSRARCLCGHHVDIHRRSNSVMFCSAVVEGGHHCPCNNFAGDDDEFGPHFERLVSPWVRVDRDGDQ